MTGIVRRYVYVPLWIMLFLGLWPVSQKRLLLWTDPVRFWDQAIREHPKSPEGYFERGLVFDERGEKALALRDYAKAMELGAAPRALMSWAAIKIGGGEPGEVWTMTRSALLKRNMRAGAFMLRGALSELKGRKRPALHWFGLSLKADPGYVPSLMARAAVLLKNDRPDMALPDLKRALSAEPDFCGARYLSGMALLRLERWDEAATAFKRLRKDGWLKEGLSFQLGYAYLKSGRWDLAQASYEQSVREDPAFSEAYFHLGLLHLEERRIELARAYFKEALKLDPSNKIYIDMLEKFKR